MSERWFLALWPDPATREALVTGVCPRIPEGVRAAHPADIHLTLVFLGELEPARLGCVEDAVGAVTSPPLALELDRVGHFARSRVLWCGPSQAPTGLVRLVEDLQGALARQCRIPPERRPYRPHMTLARKVSRRVDCVAIAPIHWMARELVLAYGVSGLRPRYRVHRRWPLRSAS